MKLPVPGSPGCSEEEVTHPKTAENAHEKWFLQTCTSGRPRLIIFDYRGQFVVRQQQLWLIHSRLVLENHGMPIYANHVSWDMGDMGTHGFLLILT